MGKGFYVVRVKLINANKRKLEAYYITMLIIKDNIPLYL